MGAKKKCYNFISGFGGNFTVIADVLVGHYPYGIQCDLFGF